MWGLKGGLILPEQRVADPTPSNIVCLWGLKGGLALPELLQSSIATSSQAYLTAR